MTENLPPAKAANRSGNHFKLGKDTLRYEAHDHMHRHTSWKIIGRINYDKMLQKQIEISLFADKFWPICILRLVSQAEMNELVADMQELCHWLNYT